MATKTDFLALDVKEIKGDVKTLLQQSAVHTQVLSEHEKRSRQLEERFQPIEAIYIFGAKAAILLTVLATIGTLIQVGLGLLKK